MKKICLLILFLLLPCLAFGETAFPACQGTVTDLAAVMEENAVKDIEILSDRYEQAAGGRLYVITRHFLGGKEAANYTRTLFENWNLKENDILLMMVIGEENYALALGKEAQKALPDELAVTLFSTHFSSDFMNRQYNTAAGEILCQVSSAICKAQGKSFSTDGLFGRLETEPYQPSFTEELKKLHRSRSRN